MSLTQTELDYLLETIARRSGNVITSSQQYLVESSLTTVLRETGHSSMHEVVRELQQCSDGPLHDLVTESMTINETSFFRDVKPFQFLRDTVLPDLLSNRTTPLSIWSAACSSGQEPYSLAILLAENFPQLSSREVKILATDISEKMVRRTHEGVFTQMEVNRGLPERALAQYFQRNGLSWKASDTLRQMIRAELFNLTYTWRKREQYDIVFMRNVLIYFNRETKIRVLRQLRQCIRPDGWLFLGGGETLLGLDVPFRRSNRDDTVCFRPA